MGSQAAAASPQSIAALAAVVPQHLALLYGANIHERCRNLHGAARVDSGFQFFLSLERLELRLL